MPGPKPADQREAEIGELLAVEGQAARGHGDLVVGRNPVEFVVHRRSRRQHEVSAQVQDALRIAGGQSSVGIDRNAAEIARAAQGAAVDADRRIGQPAIDDQFAWLIVVGPV